MEKSKALIFDTLVDVVMKSGETYIGYINKQGMQKESESNFVKLANKQVTKGVRSVEKRIKTTQIASISKSKEKTPNF